MDWHIEPLEQRTLLSAAEALPSAPTITLSGDVVIGIGTPDADTAKVRENGTNLVVTIDSVKKTFPLGTIVSVQLSMLAGADSISIGTGTPAVLAQGGGGNDTIVAANAARDTLEGKVGADLISAGTGGDFLGGGKGPDTLLAGGGNDTLVGGNGNDSLTGGPGHDSLEGGPGNDVIAGSPTDTPVGGGGNDTITN
jgi:Ca2+-binding RTX toxin-like protein